MVDHSPWGIQSKLRHAGSGIARAAWRQSYYGRKHGSPSYPRTPEPRPPSRTQPTNVKGMQKFLRKRGYNLAVDGVMGPMTRNAASAFRHGIKANAWNSKYAQMDDAQRHNTPANENNQRVGGTQRAGANRQGKAMRVDSGKSGGVKMPEGSAGGALFPGLDPDVYARSVVDAEFGPQLSELSREEGRTRTAGQNRIHEMADMYNALGSRADTYAAEDNAARQRAIEQISGLASGLGKGIALDPLVSADMAGHGDIASDTARLIDMSERGYSSGSRMALQKGGLFEGRQARDTLDASLEEIYGKRRDLLAQRGAKRTATQADLMKWATETDMARQSLGLESLKTFEGIRSSREGSKIDRLNAQANLTRAGKTNKAFPSKFKNLSPAQRRQVGDAVLNTVGDIVDAQGNPRSQDSIVRMINSSLRSYGYKPRGNKNVGLFALDLYRRITGKAGDSRWWGLGKGG